MAANKNLKIAGKTAAGKNKKNEAKKNTRTQVPGGNKPFTAKERAFIRQAAMHAFIQKHIGPEMSAHLHWLEQQKGVHAEMYHGPHGPSRFDILFSASNGKKMAYRVVPTRDGIQIEEERVDPKPPRHASRPKSKGTILFSAAAPKPKHFSTFPLNEVGFVNAVKTAIDHVIQETGRAIQPE